MERKEEKVNREIFSVSKEWDESDSPMV